MSEVKHYEGTVGSARVRLAVSGRSILATDIDGVDTLSHPVEFQTGDDGRWYATCQGKRAELRETDAPQHDPTL